MDFNVNVLHILMQEPIAHTAADKIYSAARSSNFGRDFLRHRQILILQSTAPPSNGSIVTVFYQQSRKKARVVPQPDP